MAVDVLGMPVDEVVLAPLTWSAVALIARPRWGRPLIHHAARAGVPVLPVAIRGARSVLRSDNWLARPGAITLISGIPQQSLGSDWEATVQLRDAVRGQILRAGGEPDLAV